MKRKISFSLTLALMLAMLVSAIALADNLVTDGDGLTPVVDTPSLNLGNVCTGTTVSKTVLHAISRQGTGQNVYANGALVAVSVTSVSGSGLSAGGGGTISLLGNWVSQPNNTLSQPVASGITFIAGPTPRSFNGTVNYQAVGSGNTGGTLTRSDSLAVSANVINCDTTPPTLSLPDDIIVEATGPLGAQVTFTATATDANPANPVVTCAPNSGAMFGFGPTTVNCSATDAAGNTATGSFTVTVQDTTPPIVTPPDNITAEAAGPDGVAVTYSGQSAVDIVDGARPVSCVPVSGSTFALGETTVTCSASDTRGNIGTASFIVNIQDTTAPILALPADISAEAENASGAVVTFSASASDLVDGEVEVSCAPASGSTFPLGETNVSCSAADANGNAASGSFKVNVVDTTPPVLTLPDSFVVEATAPGGAVAVYSASAYDLVDGPVAVSCAPASGAFFALGANVVSCAATDSAGNTATDNFTIMVVDTTPPTLTLPADQQLEAAGPDGAQAFFTVSANDIVDGALAVSCSANSGDTFPLGTTAVTCSVSDAAGNPASGSFVIIVEDTTPPVITFVSRAPANAFGWNSGNVTVTWSCADAVGVIADTVSVTVSSEGANQSATGVCQDVSGLTASNIQTGINIDKTAPVVSLIGGPANDGVYYFGFVPEAPTCAASDELSGLNGSCQVSGYSNVVGTHLLAAGAGDKAGNSAVTTKSYTVLPWTLKGFYQPVDMGGVYNTVKGGSTVPLKFEIFAGNTELTDPAYVKSLTYAVSACLSSFGTDEIETVATGNTSLRYDTVAGQFIYNWKTPTGAGKCYRFTVTTIDGSTLVAYLKLK